jgi:hypothetical protein
MYMPMVETVGGVLEANNQLELLETPRRQFSRLLVEQSAIEEQGLEIETSVVACEWLVALAAINEAAHELGVKTIAGAIARVDEIMALASRIAHLDATAAFFKVHVPTRKPVHASQAPAAPMSVVARGIESAVVLCPIQAIEALALQLGREADAHNCRVRFEWLKAFVHRHGPERDGALLIAGRAYAEGRLSACEVASLLEVRPSDAIAMLEKHGFCRTAGMHLLADAQRSAIFAKMREDRLARGGSPRPSKSLVKRDVIASERIEGVDVRSWVDPTR